MVLQGFTGFYWVLLGFTGYNDRFTDMGMGVHLELWTASDGLCACKCDIN